MRHVYVRRNFEKVRRSSTGGIADIIHPEGVAQLALVSRLTPNW